MPLLQNWSNRERQLGDSASLGPFTGKEHSSKGTLPSLLSCQLSTHMNTHVYILIPIHGKIHRVTNINGPAEMRQLQWRCNWLVFVVVWF